MLIPPHEIRKHAIGPNVVRGRVREDRSLQPRVISNKPLLIPALMLLGRPKIEKMLSKTLDNALKIPKLKSISIIIFAIIIYPPTIKMLMIESYMVVDIESFIVFECGVDKISVFL